MAKIPSAPGAGAPDVGGTGSFGGNTTSVVEPRATMAADWPDVSPGVIVDVVVVLP